jgi:hypothetical protein
MTHKTSLSTKLSIACCSALLSLVSINAFADDAKLSKASYKCGPGPNWINKCPSDFVDIQMMAKFQLNIPCEKEASVTVLHGPGRVYRTPVDTSIQRAYYEVVSAKMTSADSDITLRMGRDQGVKPTIGTITQMKKDPTIAVWEDSNYFEIDTKEGTLFHTEGCDLKGSDLTFLPPPKGIPRPLIPCINYDKIPMLDKKTKKVMGCLVIHNP